MRYACLKRFSHNHENAFIPIHTVPSVCRKMKPTKTITDPEAFKVLADESRRRIIYLLRAKEMTVSQIAQELELTPQTVYHHVKRLVEKGMVEVSKEVRVDHLIESYYRATAEMFHLTVGKTTNSKETLEESIQITLNALIKLGYNVHFTKNDAERLAELTMELDDCCSAKTFEEAISQMDDVDYLTKQTITEYASLLTMTDAELKKQEEIKREFQKILRSLVK
jgi:DNA-binding transcriptional ArsR family regulator